MVYTSSLTYEEGDDNEYQHRNLSSPPVDAMVWRSSIPLPYSEWAHLSLQDCDRDKISRQRHNLREFQGNDSDLTTPFSRRYCRYTLEEDAYWNSFQSAVSNFITSKESQRQALSGDQGLNDPSNDEYSVDSPTYHSALSTSSPVFLLTDLDDFVESDDFRAVLARAEQDEAEFVQISHTAMQLTEPKQSKDF